MKKSILFFALLLSFSTWASNRSFQPDQKSDWNTSGYSETVKEAPSYETRVVSMTRQQMVSWLTTQYPGIWGDSFAALRRSQQEAQINAYLPDGESIYSLSKQDQADIIVDIVVAN